MTSAPASADARLHDVATIAVVGAGQMGCGIAQVAAVAGFRTIVHDSAGDALGACEAAHSKRLTREVEKGRLSPSDAEAAAGRIAYAHMISGIESADLVVEAVTEDAKLKRRVFGDLDSRYESDRVILATNTSSISVTEIAAATARPERVIGMHFFYPVPVMPLVEIIAGLETSPGVSERVASLTLALGKTPLHAADRPGFASNRVLMPMINEAFYAWMEGVAEPEAIDGIMTLGCNFPMGPLRLADFIGLDTCRQIMEVMAEGLNDPRYAPCPLLKQLVESGRLGDKTGRGVYEHRPAGG